MGLFMAILRVGYYSMDGMGWDFLTARTFGCVFCREKCLLLSPRLGKRYAGTYTSTLEVGDPLIAFLD
jgi:hypothetical protein